MTNERVRFGLFDKDAEIAQSQRDLPHWFQPGVAVFVTFRTADSMPRLVVENWQQEQREWLRQNGIEVGAAEDSPAVEDLPGHLREKYRDHRSRRWHAHLDECHGACLLREGELATIVADALRYFDGDRYDLDCFVIMPNHVHVLAQFRPPITCRQQCAGWLRFTARRINAMTGKKGSFWQVEPFDHLVRSEEQFCYLRGYIRENPAKARLRDGEFIYWMRA